MENVPAPAFGGGGLLYEEAIQRYQVLLVFWCFFMKLFSRRMVLLYYSFDCLSIVVGRFAAEGSS